MADNKLPSSFRDPSGFLFVRKGVIYRQINNRYKADFDCLIQSGLYQNLVDAGLLIPHEEVAVQDTATKNAYKIIKPDRIPFVSYPYEWCFSQLKDAALITLEIQKRALALGMSLKDGSAYNIQFKNGKPVLIDTLSFERYQTGHPWVAYRQFCQHFLAPLVLMQYKDIRLNQLLRVHIDGIPLDLTSVLLPVHTKFRFSLLSHIHLHAKSQKKYAKKDFAWETHEMKKISMIALINHLEATLQKLNWSPQKTEWGNYYEDTNYSLEAFQHKKQIVSQFIDKIHPTEVWDLGANVGVFSRISSNRGIHTIAFDMDPAAVEKNYLECVKRRETFLLPLLLDLNNPSPNLGWENQERMSLIERGPADTVLALALIHHLAISNNLPFANIARFLSHLCNSLVIEFVPKSDNQVKRLLSTREDIFSEYDSHHFENAFSKHFSIKKAVPINNNSERTIYLMQKD